MGEVHAPFVPASGLASIFSGHLMPTFTANMFVVLKYPEMHTCGLRWAGFKELEPSIRRDEAVLPRLSGGY